MPSGESFVGALSTQCPGADVPRGHNRDEALARSSSRPHRAARFNRLEWPAERGFFRLVKVSVVIPTYNRRELLPRAVASVLSQDPPVQELVIVDDGSSDDTGEWALSIGDPRVTVIERPHSGNIAHLHNVGAAASTAGEYLAFLDSDDWWHRDKLEIQMAGAPFEWSFGLVDVDGKGPIGCGNTAPEVIAAELLDSQRVGAPVSTLVVSQELFDQVGGFDENPLTCRQGPPPCLAGMDLGQTAGRPRRTYGWSGSLSGRRPFPLDGSG